MRLIGCHETLTLIRHEKTPEGDTYTCEAIAGCSWFSKHGSTASTNGKAPTTDVTVRIPADLAPDPLPAAGELLVRGVLGSYESRESLKGYEAFRIAYVGDNRRTKLLPHVVVKSQ